MMPLSCCNDIGAWAWVVGIGLFTALLLRCLNPAYTLGGSAKVLLLGAGGAVAGTAGAHLFAHAAPGAEVVAVCAWAGSLALLDVNHLVCCRRPAQDKGTGGSSKKRHPWVPFV